MDNQNISSANLLIKIYKWRKPLVIYTGLAAVISIVITLLIAPQYHATSIIFPVRQFSVSKLLIEQNNGNQEDYMEIGDEDDAEKIIQVLNSDNLKLKVANYFNLWERWKINKDKFDLHYLQLKWDNMVKIKRTDFNSIKIEAFDYSAQGAADISNSIVSFCDTVRKEMVSDMANKAFNIVKEEYENTIERMNVLEDSLQVLRKLGVLDYKTDVEAYTRSYAKALEKGNSQGIKQLEAKLDTLKKYGGAYLQVSENLRKYRFKFPVIKSKYDDAQINKDKVLPFMFVVEKAKPDEYKARPFKSLIVIISAASTFLLVFLFLLFKEEFEKHKEQFLKHK